MLVLSRKSKETIRIGDNVTITVIKAKGNTVRLGIEAPRDVRVMRGEILRAVEETLQETNDSPSTAETEDCDTSLTSSEVDSVPECATPLSISSRCPEQSFYDASEETRCAASYDRAGDRRSSECPQDYEGDCWSVSSMRRRVRQVMANQGSTQK